VSTNIVVDVALAALRQLNQAQVNANRQAKLLADRNSTLAQKAVDADAVVKAQKGQAPDGTLLYGIRSDRQRVQQQPIAIYRTESRKQLTLATISYSWTSGRDLDTTTSLTAPVVEGPVGWDHSESTTYLSWSGDDTSSAGDEVVTVDLAALVNDYPSATAATLSLAGNWYAEQGSQATITVTVNITGESPAVTSAIKPVTLYAQGGTGQSMGTVSIDLRKGTPTIS
jgi:hypothetical protein